MFASTLRPWVTARRLRHSKRLLACRVVSGVKRACEERARDRALCAAIAVGGPEVWAAASASLALASKLEERTRRLRDVVVVFHRLQMREVDGEEGAPEFAGGPTPGIEVGAKEYEDLKKEVTRAERYILRELGFDCALFLDLPHAYVLRYAGALAKDAPSELAQRAWSYLNDALRTALSLKPLPQCCVHPLCSRGGSDVGALTGKGRATSRNRRQLLGSIGGYMFLVMPFSP